MHEIDRVEGGRFISDEAAFDEVQRQIVPIRQGSVAYEEAVVLDAAVPSWPPIEPRCLRWTFPVWTPDDSLDPAALPSRC